MTWVKCFGFCFAGHWNGLLPSSVERACLLRPGQGPACMSWEKTWTWGNDHYKTNSSLSGCLPQVLLWHWARVVEGLLAHVLFPSGVSCRSGLCHQSPGPGQRSWVSAVSREGRKAKESRCWSWTSPLSKTQLPPGAFYQWVQIQADVSRLGRHFTLREKEKQMFSEYVARQVDWYFSVLVIYRWKI